MRDSDVRAAVLSTLSRCHANDANTRVVEEMGIWSGSVRIDVAVINGELSGYELKSDRDTLQRLPQQVELYGLVFDRLTLVVGTKHSEKAVAMLPEWWSVLIAFEQRGSLTLQPVKIGSANPHRDPYFVAQLLWREEAVAALEAFDLARGWRSKAVKLIHERLAAEVPLASLATHVRSALKRRPGWLGQTIGHQGEVSVGDIRCPLRPPSRRDRTVGDLFDSIVSPTTS